MQKEQIISSVEQHGALLRDVARQIWSYAELSLQEYQSAALFKKVLSEQGFTVEENLAGIETAFSGSFGSGKPIIGILGEFDALSGLSQRGGISQREPLTEGGSGHGCGHHLLGAGALGAAIAAKEYLQESGREGTVIFFGCPGEEGGAGKAFMAREGLWKKLDAALTWHPADVNEVVTGTCNSCIQKEYIFTGRASHAAENPAGGRSGLDAVQLMNMAVEFMREHMPTSARIHYAITNSGGLSPNVVQPFAKVLYMVRDIAVKDTLLLQERVDKIAQAAAVMTETELTVRFIDGTANTVPNFTLERALYQSFDEIGVPEYSDEEIEYAKEIIASYEAKPTELPSYGAKHSPEVRAAVAAATQDGSKPLNDFLVPSFSSNAFAFGSTDVGDVSWLTPTAQIHTVCYPSGSPGHSWQQVACGTTEISMKGMLTAAKVIAATAAQLFEQPELLKAARKEFLQQAKGGYQCPIPNDAVPTMI